MKNLDLYVANLAVGNIKLHNLHWNVKGNAFKQVHEYLEYLYDDAFAKFDEVAELQKMSGIYPKASVKEYLEISNVKEIDSKDYSIEEAMNLALEYISGMKKLALEIREESNKNDNFPVSNIMESHIEGYNKQIWFMESMMNK